MTLWSFKSGWRAQSARCVLVLSKKGMLNRLLAYIEVLLPLFRDADWFSNCACYCIFWQLCTEG